MFQQLRKILNIDTLEDKLISYKNSKEEINILKSSLDELASEYQEASQLYLNNKSQLQTEIKKGNDESSRLWSRIDNRFQSYLKTYINNLSEIKKSIDKEQSNLNDLLKDEQLYSLIQKSDKLEAFEVIKQDFRKGLVSRDLFHKAQLEVEEYLEKGDSKTKYSDCIIRNSEGKILFLKRSPNSDFEPNKLCLAGGHIDLGETPQEAATRECQEETGLKVKDCWLVDQFEDDKCHIYYYECTIDNEFINPFHSEDLPIVLTNSEHFNYCWLDKDEWQTEDLLMGLKDKLNQMFVNDIEKQAIEVILKAVEEGKLDHSYIDKIEKAIKPDRSKLVKKRRLVTRDGKTFVTTVYVNPEGDIVKEEDVTETHYYSKIDDIKIGDIFKVRTSKTDAEIEITRISSSEKGLWIGYGLGKDVKYISLGAIKEIKKVSKSTKIEEPITAETKSLPTSTDGMAYVKVLGGSSGVELRTLGGKYFALKKSHKGDEKQIIQENCINKIYNSLGINAANTEYDSKNKVLISEYIEGAKELGSETLTDGLKKEVQKGFVLDCLLANWDVLGSHKDNVLIKDGKVIRIDNGGCLNIRAKGGDKFYSDEVNEINTLREFSPGKEIFAGISDEEIKNQIEFLIKNSDKLNPIKELSGGESLFNTTIKRLEWLDKKFNSKKEIVTETKKTEETKVDVETLRSDMPSLETQRYFDSKWKDVNINGNKGLKEHIKENIIRIEKANEKSYKETAKKLGISVEELKRDLQSFTEKIVSKSKGYIVAHSSLDEGGGCVEKIISEGRFKTQFETGTSKGSLSTLMRTNAENSYFNFGSAKENKENRPIYGFFTDQPHGVINEEGKIPPKRRTSQYGDICFEIKNEKFRKDGTVTFMDSLGSYDSVAATPVSAPHFTSLGEIDVESYKQAKSMAEGKVGSGIGGYSYVETQYHGQLTLNDVKQIHISVEEVGRRFSMSGSDNLKALSRVVNEVNRAVAVSNKPINIEIF